MNVETMCMSCMTHGLSEKSSICSKCGIKETDLQRSRSPHQLPLRSVLSKRYIVGKVLGEGGFGITYAGWDMNCEKKVAIKEYFPNGFVVRDVRNGSTVLNNTWC